MKLSKLGSHTRSLQIAILKVDMSGLITTGQALTLCFKVDVLLPANNTGYIKTVTFQCTEVLQMYRDLVQIKLTTDVTYSHFL